MLRWTARLSCFMVLLLSASFALAQTEFSGDLDDSKRPDNQTKIYFAKDKVRFDTKGSDAKGGSVLMNLTTQSMIVIMPQQHMYMEMPAQMKDKRNVFSFFKTTDVENACGDWLKLADNKGGSCHKIGSADVNGRSTVQYEGTNAKGEVSHVWLDPKLRFPIKWQTKNSDGELRNIQEGPQPDSLFEIPAGFTKMDMGGMMQQH
jgi:Domain of unknown function (DUF4412)